MSGGYGWVEFAVFGPLVLGLAVWQLWSVNREIAKDKEHPARRVADRHLINGLNEFESGPTLDLKRITMSDARPPTERVAEGIIEVDEGREAADRFTTKE